MEDGLGPAFAITRFNRVARTDVADATNRHGRRSDERVTPIYGIASGRLCTVHTGDGRCDHDVRDRERGDAVEEARLVNDAVPSKFLI